MTDAGTPGSPPRPALVDRSGRRYDLDAPVWRGADGSPLAVSQLPGLTPDEIDRDVRSLWRYRAALPVDATQRVSLGEGWTPLIELDWAGHEVHAKLEWFNPTSSFKDRGTSVLMTHLRSRGVGQVLEDSSGNGGASVAAYAAAAGIGATVLVPATTSAAKVLQVRAFGAHVERIAGTRAELAAEAVRRSADVAYASHNWHPMFLQGVKTIGYEIWEMLGFRAPDNVVLVAGAGSLVLGCDLAFGELLAAGQIDRLPRLLVGQPEGWATIVETLEEAEPGAHGEDGGAEHGGGRDAGHGTGRDAAHGPGRNAEHGGGRDARHAVGQGAGRGARRSTIAEGATIADPVRLPEVVAAVRRSGGAGYAVPEPEVHDALRRLASRGLYAEPTSAVAAAALDHFLRSGTIRAGETTVLVLTGTGLKSTEAMGDVFAPAP